MAFIYVPENNIADRNRKCYLVVVTHLRMLICDLLMRKFDLRRVPQRSLGAGIEPGREAGSAQRGAHRILQQFDDHR